MNQDGGDLRFPQEKGDQPEPGGVGDRGGRRGGKCEIISQGNSVYIPVEKYNLTIVSRMLYCIQYSCM